jgi:flagellin
MALTVNTNIAAMNAFSQLNRTNRGLSRVLSRISSGQRITKAADDAAGLAVAENLDAAKRSLGQAIRNTSDGVSLIQTAEGATSEVTNILKRMRELAVQSASETLANPERQFIETEFVQLRDEIDRIASTTNFNDVPLTNGSDTQIEVQVGILNTAADRITIVMGDLRASVLGVDTTQTLGTVAGAQAMLTTLDAALDVTSGYRAGYGAFQNRLESAQRNLEIYQENLAAAESSIRDADFAKETAEMSKYQIMQQAGTAVLGQANQINQGAVQLIGN